MSIPSADRSMVTRRSTEVSNANERHRTASGLTDEDEPREDCLDRARSCGQCSQPHIDASARALVALMARTQMTYVPARPTAIILRFWRPSSRALRMEDDVLACSLAASALSSESSLSASAASVCCAAASAAASSASSVQGGSEHVIHALKLATKFIAVSLDGAPIDRMYHLTATGRCSACVSEGWERCGARCVCHSVQKCGVQSVASWMWVNGGAPWRLGWPSGPV
jgi:hypothetical protein